MGYLNFLGFGEGQIELLRRSNLRHYSRDCFGKKNLVIEGWNGYFLIVIEMIDDEIGGHS